jgi:hypothetical protein
VWGRNTECEYRTTPIAIGGISNTEVKGRNAKYKYRSRNWNKDYVEDKESGSEDW